jgi:Skp family chaperone for outer membrane proteins
MMSITMRSVLALSCICLATGLGTAQTRQTSPLAPPATTQPATGVPKGKIAVINSSLLQQEINEFKVKIDALNREFEPRVKEVRSLADRITSLENTIKTQSGVLPAERLAESADEVERMKREYQRRTEDLQADGTRARDKSFAPINEKLTAFLKDYTAKRNITLLIDLANDPSANLIVWVDARIDVTRDFISEYNKANPVTAAAPQKP